MEQKKMNKEKKNQIRNKITEQNRTELKSVSIA